MMTNLVYKPFSMISLDDPFFDSLKEDYIEFPSWFNKKIIAGENAYVFENEAGHLDGFLYVKIESEALSDVIPVQPASIRLKVGTMKINPHGTKLGERFIKKIIDHALHEKISEIYLTVFEKHKGLINILSRYGFEAKASKTTQNGTELVFFKNLDAPYVDILPSYPNIMLTGSNVYILSLLPNWHTRLLPDSILKNESADIVQDVSHTNSIHKVYLASMSGMSVLKRGDIILIYRTSDQEGRAYYRSVVTSVCVVEEYKDIHDFQSESDFIAYCQPFSIFEPSELKAFWARKKYNHIIKFSYNMALKKRITRGELIENIGLSSSAYYGFMPITNSQFLSILKRAQSDESITIY